MAARRRWARSSTMGAIAFRERNAKLYCHPNKGLWAGLPQWVDSVEKVEKRPTPKFR
jgi:hypothetical protein